MKLRGLLTALVVVGLGVCGWLAYSRVILSPSLGKARSASPLRMDSPIPSANNGFAFRLFGQITAGEPAKNVFISPTSISLALSMTLNGAGGATMEAMAKTLGFGGIPLDVINRDNAGLMRALERGDPNVEVSIANSLWLKDGIKFKSDFLSRTQKAYEAEITNLDFSSASAPDRVNGWVDKATRGKIHEIVSQESLRAAAMVLVNAVYFNGKWTEPFKESMTTDRAFHLAGRQAKTVRMMRQDGRYEYLETPEFQAIILPYGDKGFSMYVFLPSEKSSLGGFMKKLNAASWGKWQSAMGMRRGEIMLPRFKMEYEKELVPTLASLGMGNAFSSAADFSGMTAAGVFIGRVIHKTFLGVNEAGTEAAAVTGIDMAISSSVVGHREMPFTMIVDRPFFCAIVDNDSRSILFIGTIYEPSGIK